LGSNVRRRAKDRAPQTGLRERKRVRTHNAIVNAASKLFAANGIEGTPMEAIASAADVSIASLYNYFPSKDVLLAELIERGIREFIGSTDALFRRNYPTAAAGYIALIKSHFKWFDSVERSWLRRFSAHALMRVDITGARFSGIEALMQAQVLRMSESLVAQGRLCGTNTDVEQISRLVWSVASAEYYMYVADDARRARDVCATLSGYLSLIAPLNYSVAD
jgi:AcrR family transcriptional regulator